MKVADGIYEKTGFTEEQILQRYEAAKIGFDGSFTFQNYLFGINKQCLHDTIIYLGEIPIEWYEEDLKTEEEERIRKAKEITERQKRLFRRAEGTRTERRRNKKGSEYIARNTI